ncbi:MAG: hypothetical protein AAFR38_13490 [Planctomycetota bacterium]
MSPVTPPHEPFGPWADLAGFEWEISTAFWNGAPYRARCEIELDEFNRTIECRTYEFPGASTAGPGRLVVRSSYWVDRNSGDLIVRHIDSAGLTSTGVYEFGESAEGHPLYRTESETVESGSPVERRTEFELRGDHFLWRVATRPAGSNGDWFIRLDGRWERSEPIGD